MSNKLLVIAYRFPPMGGVGSRRWAKFCKYLCYEGWDVHVVTSRYDRIDEVNWLHDVINLTNLTLIRLPSGYPQFLLRPRSRKGIANNFLYIINKILQKILSRFYSSDYAELWIDSLVPFVANYLTKEGIKNLIVSGPPSSLHVAGALIKSEIPDINLIQDYRDPWSSVYDYSMKTLNNHKKKLNILNMEKISLQAANHVVVTTEKMGVDLVNIFGIAKTKITTITNGFDECDYKPSCNHLKKPDSADINVVYMGQFGTDPDGRIKGLKLIAAALELLPASISSRFKFHIYSDLTQYSISNTVFPKFCSVVKLYGMVNPEEISSILAMTDICLSINRDEDSYAIASKVYDCMGGNKSIIQITPPGVIFDILEENNQYVSLPVVDNISRLLTRICSEYDSVNGLSTWNKPNIKQYELSQLTKKYSKLFI